jgi:hypothetical protein
LDEELPASYKGETKNKPTWLWTGPEGTSSTTAKIVAGKLGKYTVTAAVPGKDPKDATVVVAPAELKGLATQKWYWKGPLTPSTGSTGAGVAKTGVVETIVITNDSFKVDNSIARTTSSTGKEYFYFTINNWAVTTAPSGALPNGYNEHYLVSGTAVTSGYSEFTSFKVSFNKNGDGAFAGFVRTSGPTSASVYNLFVAAGTGAGPRIYNTTVQTPDP